MSKKKIYVHVDDHGQPVFTPEYHDGVMSCWRGSDQTKKFVFLMADPDYIFMGGTWEVATSNSKDPYKNLMKLIKNNKKAVAKFGSVPNKGTDIVFDLTIGPDLSLPADDDDDDDSETQTAERKEIMHPSHGGGRLKY